jgi:hypothetical protein
LQTLDFFSTFFAAAGAKLFPLKEPQIIFSVLMEDAVLLYLAFAGLHKVEVH